MSTLSGKKPGEQARIEVPAADWENERGQQQTRDKLSKQGFRIVEVQPPQAFGGPYILVVEKA